MAGLLAQSNHFAFPLWQWHFEINLIDFTVAGTASGLNRIPF